MAAPLTVVFDRKKETPGTVVFAERESDEPPVIGTLYVKKYACKRLGDPQSLTVTVTPS